MYPFTPRPKPAALVLASALLALSVLASAAAQDPPQQPAPAQPDQTVPAPAEQPVPLELQPEVPDVLSGEDVAQGVFVRDSPVAVNQFALAARMEGLRDWAKAADVYQQVITEYGDRLIADRMDAEGKVYQYASVGRAVQRKLAAWPPEGRAVYEQRFGTPARTLLDQASQSPPADLGALQKVVRLYFITDAGREAAMLLIDRHLADGSFAAARRLSGELLETHPALGEQRPEALLRGVIAAHFLGDDEQASAYAEELATQFAQTTATVAGEPQNLAAVAQATLEAPPPQGVQTANGWPTFGGSEDRSGLGPALSSQIAPYVQDIPIPETAPGDQPLAATHRRAIASARENGQLTGIFPVAYDDTLYWSDNVHIFAVALDSGLPLPGWLDTYGGGSELPAYALPGGGFVTPRGTASTPTVTDRYVLANMGLRDQSLYVGSGNPAVAEARMVCLDRRTGRLLWECTPAELEAAVLVDPALQADLSACQFVGAPLVVGDAVWTLAKSDPMRVGQFEQCFLVSLDLETGLTRTVTYLASSSGSQPMTRWRTQGNITPEPTSILAYSDGLVYAPSDTGALAAVRASDGAVEWLNLYPRLQMDPFQRGMGASRLRMRSRTESQPFHASPVIVEGGRLFFKPPDGPQVFIWNAASGEEIGRVDLSVTERIGNTERSRSVAGNTTLLKVIGDRMLTFGPQGVSCIDWTAVHGDQTALDATLWSSPVDSPNGEDSVMGRPAVTETQVLVPTRQHLRIIQLEDGRFVATYPTGGAEWAQNEEPGNVVVLEDQLVIAGPTRLNVYADSAVIRERLEAQVAQNPADPTPLLRLAQIAFVSGDFDQTEERLRHAERAADAAGGSGEPDGSGGAVFASALGFAQTLSDRLGNALAPGSPTPQTVDRFFTLAEKFARTPAQNVRVRFARADFADTEGGPQRRVALLQEILSDPAWRQVPAIPDAGDGSSTGDGQSPRQSGEVARELLAQLIAQSGQQVYEQIERRAVQEVADAVAAADAEALGRLAEIYPNSTASTTALSEAAKLLQAMDRPADAAAALRRLAARSDGPLSAWLTLAQIEASRPDRLDVAAGRMRRAARLSPEAAAPPIKLTDGTTLQGLTVEQAAFELTDAALAADAARVPDLRLPSDPLKPLFAEQATSIAGIETLIVPIEGFERHDRLIVRRSDGTLAVFAFDQPEPVWSVPMEANAVQSAAWLPEGLLVWGASSIGLLDPETGQARWRHAVQALAPGQLLSGRDAERAVVATGWKPERVEPEINGDGQEQQLREVLEGRQQMMAGREEWRRGNALRQQVLEEARRAQAGEPADESQGEIRTPQQPVIAGVLPVGGTIGVVLGGKPGGAAGVDSGTGKIKWRSPLPEGQLSELRGAGDYLAVQIDAARSLLNVLDLTDGSLVTRRSFELEGIEPLANFLITPENELVYATRRVLTGVDLERNPQQARFTVQAEAIGENGMAFGVSAGRGRMEVIGDRLLVLADPTQSGRRDALVINLARGAPETLANPAGGEPHNLLLTAAEGPEEDVNPDELPPRLRAEQRNRQRQQRRDAMRAMAAQGAPGERIWTAGFSVYLTGDRGLSAYDLKVPGRHWKRLNAQVMREFDPAINVGVMIGRDDLLLFDQPQATPRRQIDQPVLRVTSFSRDRLADGRESGQQRHEVELVPGAFGLDAPVGAYQAMNGGLAVLTESGRLLFLRGE